MSFVFVLPQYRIAVAMDSAYRQACLMIVMQMHGMSKEVGREQALD